MAVEDLTGDETDSARKSAPLTAFLVSLPLRRIGPLLTTFLAALLTLPLLCLVVLSPTLFVTEPPAAVLALWLEAQALLAVPPSAESILTAIAEGELLHLLLIHLASLMTETPGQALLMAQGLMTLILVGPVAYGAAMRLSLLPALLASLLVLVTALVPAGGITGGASAMAAAVFLWLGLISYARPVRMVQRCAQIEGLAAGIGVWCLFMTSTPLFLLSLAGLLAAMILQGQRGMIFTTMALASLLMLGASAELLLHMTLGPQLSGPLTLTLLRLDQVGPAFAAVPLTLSHLLAVMLIPLGLMIGRPGFLVSWAGLLFLLGAGVAVFLYTGLDPLPLLLMTCLMVMSGRAVRPGREDVGLLDKYALAGLLALLTVPMVLAGVKISAAASGLYAQFQAVPLPETERLGFSFAEQPVKARMILARKLDPFVTREGLQLTPADQAVLMQEGVRLAGEMAAARKPVRLVSAGDTAHLTGIVMPELGKADYVLTPRIAIDALTDEARVSSQAVLYTEYQKAPRQDQLSPVWDIWIRRQAY